MATRTAYMVDNADLETHTESFFRTLTDKWHKIEENKNFEIIVVKKV